MLLPDMTVLLYTAVAYKYYPFVALLLFCYHYSSGVHFKNTKPTPICVASKKKVRQAYTVVSSASLPAVLKLLSFAPCAQHYRML